MKKDLSSIISIRSPVTCYQCCAPKEEVYGSSNRNTFPNEQCSRGSDTPNISTGNLKSYQLNPCELKLLLSKSVCKKPCMPPQLFSQTNPWYRDMVRYRADALEATACPAVGAWTTWPFPEDEEVQQSGAYVSPGSVAYKVRNTYHQSKLLLARPVV